MRLLSSVGLFRSRKGFNSPESLSKYNDQINQIMARRYRIITLCGAVLFMSYSYVDRLIYPQLQVEFITMRIIVCTMLLGTYFLTHTPMFRHRIVWLVDIGLLSAQLGVCYIVYKTNGVQSTYYDGLTLIFLAILIGNSFYYLHNLLLGVIVTAFYALAVFNNPTPFDLTKFLYANYMISTTVFFIVLMTKLYESEYFYGFMKNESLSSTLEKLQDLIIQQELAQKELRENEKKIQKLNEELKQLIELRTQFFANVSHELRTPLTLILGPAGKIKKDNNLSDEQRQSIEVIIRNARLLLKHVNDLLEIARIESGKVAPSYVEFDLNTMVRTLSGNFESIAQEKNISFETDLLSPVVVQADPNMVQRILLNLIGNAFKFTPSGGKICISVQQEDGNARIVVQDSGPGVPLELREVIFERFSQGEASLAKRFGGTGLGLSIANEFVLLHGGSINVMDNPKGGARFMVSLPLQAPANTQIALGMEDIVLTQVVEQSLMEFEKTSNQKPVKIEQMSDKKGLILVVEDNPDLSHFLTDILSVQFNVQTAFNGQEGFEKAIKLKPDLILTDIMMPLVSGDQMILRIRSYPELDDVPIMLLTAKADEQLRIQLLQGGAQDYLLKPFYSEEVLARVVNLVAIRKARQHLQMSLQSTEKDLQLLTVEISKNQERLKEKAQELEKANAALKDSVLARDEFISIASHELKTPISTLKMQLEIMDRKIKPQRNEAPSSEVLKKSFDMSLKQVNIFISLINELMDVSRIRLGRLSLQLSLFNFSDLIKQSFEIFLPQLSAANCSAQLILEEDNIPVQWDRIRIQEILNNLFSNIIKYAPGKPVKVSVYRSLDEKVVIIVEDQGPGIPLKIQHKIFERFGRISPPNHVGGLGLGLFIVKHLVEAHHGTITLESDEGQGTKFVIEIPLDPKLMEMSGQHNGVK